MDESIFKRVILMTDTEQKELDTFKTWWKKDIAFSPSKRLDKLQAEEAWFARAKLDNSHELKEFCIWLTGCGYDFTQHEYFITQRDKLLK